MRGGDRVSESRRLPRSNTIAAVHTKAVGYIATDAETCVVVCVITCTVGCSCVVCSVATGRSIRTYNTPAPLIHDSLLER